MWSGGERGLTPLQRKPLPFRLTPKYIRRIALFTIGTRVDLSYSQ